jgi:hypothetical protein
VRKFFCRFSNKIYWVIGLGHIKTATILNRAELGGNLRLVPLSWKIYPNRNHLLSRDKQSALSAASA